MRLFLLFSILSCISSFSLLRPDRAGLGSHRAARNLQGVSELRSSSSTIFFRPAPRRMMVPHNARLLSTNATPFRDASHPENQSSAAFKRASVHRPFRSFGVLSSKGTTIVMMAEGGGGGGGAKGEKETKKKGKVAVKDKLDEEVVAKAKEKITNESMWRVLLHNDEIHTFDYVTHSIVKIVKQVSSVG